MRKTALFIAALALSASSYAQTWNLDKAHARVGFTITHMMVSDVDGTFKEFDATLTSSKPDFSDAVFTFTAQTASISTDNNKRDEHLRSDDFFDAAKYPTITFKSKSLKKNGANKYFITGDLTMHGVTKSVTLDLSYKGPTPHPMNKKPLAGFKVKGKVKRSDFGIGGKGFTSALGDEVEIIANGEFIQS